MRSRARQRARHLVHRVQLHAAAGQRLPAGCTSTTACELQIGGSDQWGNIIAGVDLIRRTRGRARPRVHVAAADRSRRHRSSARPPAARCGSTPAKTCPYQFRQFWMQTPTTTMVGALPADVLAAARSSEIEALHGRARRGARAASRPAGARRRDDRARARARRPQSRPPKRPSVLFGGDPTTASRGGARRRWPREIPTSTMPSVELDDPVARARRGRTGVVERRRAPHCSRSARSSVNGRQLDENAQLSAPRPAPREVPAAAQGQDVAPPRRNFFVSEVDAPRPELLAFHLRLTERFEHCRNGTRHQRRREHRKALPVECRRASAP